MKTMKSIRADIVNSILNSIPDNMKPVEYIMRVLNISKGSAYRRLKGMLPFTYDEIAILAREMDFSVDEVIHSGSREKYIIEFGDYSNDDTSTIILKVLTGYYNRMPAELKMHKRTIFMTTNNLWFVHTIHFDNLFRFYYYKYLQQSDISYLKEKMKDIVIPQSIIDIKNKTAGQFPGMTNTFRTSILDRHLFLNTMSEIQYYYRRNLIDDNELHVIAADLNSLLNVVEKEIINNEYNGNKNQYFLAERNVYTNSASIENDIQIYALIFQNNIHPVVCYDQELCRLHRAYLESHKKQSRLISSSNEQLQIAFFEKQYSYIRNLIENRDLIA